MKLRREKGLSLGIGRGRRWAEAAWYGLLSLVLLTAVVAFSTSAAAVRSETCEFCHREQAVALETSAHAAVSCNTCHDGGTWFEVVERRLALVQMLPAQVLPGRMPEAFVANDRCLSCHVRDLTATVSDGSLNMNHRAVIEKSWSCDRCHGEMAHPTGAVRASSYNMQMCLECHSANPANTETCAKCHAAPPEERAANKEARPANAAALPTPQEVTHGPQVMELHGMGDMTTCSTCHLGDFCSSCHEIELPHSPQHLATHGPSLTEGQVEQEVCATCHEPEACAECHRVDMPHPEGFLKGHPAAVDEVGRPACSRCHDEEACDQCHIRHVHPGVKSEVLDALQAKPVR